MKVLLLFLVVCVVASYGEKHKRSPDVYFIHGGTRGLGFRQGRTGGINSGGFNTGRFNSGFTAPFIRRPYFIDFDDLYDFDDRRKRQTVAADAPTSRQKRGIHYVPQVYGYLPRVTLGRTGRGFSTGFTRPYFIDFDDLYDFDDRRKRQTVAADAPSSRQKRDIYYVPRQFRSLLPRVTLGRTGGGFSTGFTRPYHFIDFDDLYDFDDRRKRQTMAADAPTH